MSTKIYRAFRTKKENLYKVLICLQQLKAQIRKKYHKKVIEKLTNIFRKTGPDIPLTFNSYKETIHNKEKHATWYDLNPETSVSIYLDQKYTYFKFFGDPTVMDEFIEELEKLNYFEDYHYQNSTDRPDHISSKDWKARSRKWDQLIEKEGTGTWGHFLHILLVEDFIEERTVPLYLLFADTSQSDFKKKLEELRILEEGTLS